MKKTTAHIGSLFSEDKGFYIILFLCIAAIGISGYVLFFTPAPQKSETLDTSIYEPSTTTEDLTPVLGTDSSFDTPVNATISDHITPEEEHETPAEPTQEDAAASAAPAASEAAPVSAPIYVRPIKGTVAMPFSGDELVYQAVLGDWRTHNGTDYTANAGDRVYAITDGTVEDIYEDALFGECVVLQHPNDLETLYMGLHETVKVHVGDTVNAGDVLGTVSSANQTEGAAGVHLHIEALQNGARIDPESLFTTAQE